MRGVGKALFSGSRFVRWATLPMIALSALVFALDSSSWTWGNAPKFAGIELGLLLLFLAIGWPVRFRWAGRILGAVVFVACAGVAWIELRNVPEGVSWTETKALGSIKALVVFGVPSLWYALRGRFGFGRDEGSPQAVTPGEKLPVLPERDSSQGSK